MTDLDYEKRICEDEMAFGRKWVEERLEKFPNKLTIN